MLEKLDVVHRCHLRNIFIYRYPKIMSIENLCKHCNAVPLSVRVDRNRWKMLGHDLHGPTEGLVCSLFAMNTLQYPGRVGGLQNNLFSLIRSDLRECHIFLNNLRDILYLRGPEVGVLIWWNMEICFMVFSDRRQ